MKLVTFALMLLSMSAISAQAKTWSQGNRGAVIQFDVVNITKPNIAGPGGMEVNSFTGNLFHKRVDLVIPARSLSIGVTYSYNSGLTKNDFGFGRGWTTNFNMMYQRSSGAVTIRCDDGRKDKFIENVGGYIGPVGVFSTLSEYTPGKFLLQTKYGMQYFFDDSTHKKLTKIQDPNGNTITLSSFVSGQPSYITDANGRSIRLGWSGGHLAYILDSIASPPRTTSYQYDARGNLKRVTYPMGYVYQYQYDARSRLIGFTDELSNIVTVAYTDSGAVTAITTPGSSATPPTTLSIVYNPAAHTTTASELVAGGVQSTTFAFDGSDRLVHIQGSCCGLDEQYQYDSQNNVTRTVNSNGSGTDCTFDSKGNRLTETNALGQTASWSYEPIFNRVTSSTDRRGNTTTFSYDTHANLLGVSKPLGVAESFTYDAFGNMVTATDGRGNTSTCTYDANGNLLSVSHPIGSESFTYDNSGNLMSCTDANGRTTSYVYDALNRRVSTTNAIGGNHIYLYGGVSNLVQETDENGHSTSYTYDALNRVIAVALPQGITIVTRDEYGNIRQSIDFKGNPTLYAYDGRNRLVSVTNSLGHSRTFTYDNNGNVLTETDFNGNLTTHQYDVVDRLTKTTDLYGHDVLLIYDQNDNAVSVTDENGHATTHTYDALNRRTQSVHPIGSQSFSYDNNGNLVSNTDPNGHTTVYSYDANNRLTSSLDPLLHTTGVSYDPVGNVVSITDPNGLTSTYSYDGLHRMVLSVNPMSEATSCTYDGVGNRITCTLPHGNGLSYVYDASNRVTSVSDALGLVASYSYDANSNLLTEADANNATTQYVYDPLDRVMSAIAPMGQSSLYSYDNNSNLVSTTDAAGGTTTYTYDGLNRQIATTFPGGLTTTCSYDAVGNPSSILDARGNTTSFIRDVMDRLTQISYPNGSHRQCTYDPAGNMLSLQDQNANTITYAYDAMNRRISRNFPDGTSDVFTYDNAGRMTSANNTAATISLTYDGADRLLSEVLNGKITSYSYNIVGRMVTTTYPGGRVVTNVMNPRLQTSSRGSGATSVADYTYDAASRLTSQTNVNSSSTSYSYNDNDWVMGVSHNRGGAPMAGFNYTFDNRGFRSTVEKLHRPDNSEKYQYDATTRLTGYREGLLVGGNIPAPVTQSQFTFDAIGNRTNSTKDAVPTTYIANSINAYTSITGGISMTPSYDANGNMTSDGVRAFTYDYMDRLTGVLDVATNAAYTYDALGRRIQKVVNGVTDRYLLGLRNYDPAIEYQVGDAVIELRDGSDVVTATYVQGEDGPVSMTKHGSVMQNYYFHQNSLGSMVAMTDDSGRVVERYEYDSFGKVSIYDSVYTPRAASTIGNVYMFGGMEYEAGTGLYIGSQEVCNKGRAYNPQIGRFMQQDPSSVMGNPPDMLNGYSYVGNNPTNCKSDETCGNGYARKNGYVVAADYNYKAQSYRFASGPRQTTSQDGTFSHRGWNGTIKGIADVTEGSAIGEKNIREIGIDELNIDVREMTTGLDVEYRLSGPSQNVWRTPARFDLKGHVTLLKREGDESNSGRHTKSGHVTLLKRNDDGSASRRISDVRIVHPPGTPPGARLTRSILKSFFETGDIPTEDQFGDVIDSRVSGGMFNPREYTIAKATPWKHHDVQGLDAPTMERGGKITKSRSNIQNNRIKVWQLMQGQSGTQAMRLKVWQLMQGQNGVSLWKEFSPAEDQLKANPRH